MTATADPTPATVALYKALAEAITKSHAVVKETKHGMGYMYANAETILEEVRGPLAACGLSVVPVSHDVVLEPLYRAAPEETSVEEDGDGNRRRRTTREVPIVPPAWLVRTVALVHRDGGCVLATSRWPIVPERGRPIDKQTAAVLTTSLAYTVRDLLLLPRVSEEIDRAPAAREEPERRSTFKRPPRGGASPTNSPPPRPAGTPSQPNKAPTKDAAKLPTGGNAGADPPRSAPGITTGERTVAAPTGKTTPSVAARSEPAACIFSDCGRPREPGDVLCRPHLDARAAEARATSEPGAEERATKLADAVGLRPGDAHDFAPPVDKGRVLEADERRELWEIVLETLLGDEAEAGNVFRGLQVSTLTKPGVTYAQGAQAIDLAQKRRDELDAKTVDAAEPAGAGKDW